ncbi:MAG TPA: enoyl-CoA hydratase-related protein [Pyrinomonadaceae bacterium]|nr:enoyl-CoA hydratase-related protein [Pyrinomonadaceae bacterium]
MSELLTATQNGIRTLTLNRPEKRNALNSELIASLTGAMRDAGRDDSLRAVVIRGEGKDFCSGADLEELRKISSYSYEENLYDARKLVDLFTAIRTCPVPVIAAVHGRALAGGCGLATACDIVLAAATARFGYPEVKIGFVPAIVMAILRRNISEKRAFELVTRGFDFSAEEAKEMGLVNQIFPDAEFDGKVDDFAGEYSKVSASAVRLSKQLLYQMDGKNFFEAVDAGAIMNARARMTEDCKQGVSRFLKKK